MTRRPTKFQSQLTSFFLSFTLLMALAGSVFAPAAMAATTDKCDGTSTQNSYTVTASHGKVFYIDSGQNQNIDAAYVGYKINVGAAKTNVWAKLDNFTGGVVGLADPNDAAIPVGDISSGYKSAYFLLKASTSSTSAQSHVVHIYEGKPGLAGSVERYSCTFSFTKVSETIKAAANKVDSIAASATSFTLGQTMTITVRGATGTIGSGTALDADMMWLSPASRSSWPSSELRLKSTSVDFWENQNYTNNHVTGYPVSDVLQIKNLRAVVGKNPYKLYYEVVYTFQVVGKTPSSVGIAPVAQISSGTQIKHTDMSSLPTANVNTDQVTVNATLTKSVATAAEVVGGKMRMTYTLTLRNQDTANAVTVDQIMDKPSSSLTYVAGTATLNGSTVSSANEPSLDSAGYLVYSKPITIAASGTATFLYKMEEKSACTSSTAFSYTNSAYAKIGTVTVGSGASTFSFTTAGGTCGSTTLTDTSTVNTTLPVEVVTIEASSVLTTSATLNAMVDPNSNSGQTVSFQWGTSSTLSGATTVNLAATTTSATSPYAVSTGLTGLSTGTIYYFRIKVGSVYGAILSFVTTEPVGTPTVITKSVSGVTQVGSGGGASYNATFNGVVDPNQVSLGAGAKFEYGLDGTQSSHGCLSLSGAATTGVVYNLDETGAEVTNSPINLTSAFPTDVSKNITSLDVNKWYCYRVVATWSTSSSIAGDYVSFYTGTINAQTITFPQPSSQSVGGTLALTGGSAATTTSNLTITYTSNTPSVCTVSGTTITMVSGGVCSITASQPGNYQYYEATPVTVTFSVVAPNKTVTFNNNGGSGTISNQTTNTTTPLTTNTFSRTGFTFVGWSTTSGIQDVVYSDGGDYDFSADITVYAQWLATITYDANGATSGSAPSSQTGGPSAVIATRTNTDSLAKSNLTFAGWNTAANGTGTAYAAGSNLTISGSLTLYAQYHAVLTYDGNSKTSGTVASPVSQLPGNITLDTGTALARTNYSFAGWNTLSTGLGTSYDTLSVYNLTVNTTLYAKWNATITYDANTADSGAVPTSQTSTAGSTITLRSNSGPLVKASSSFGGWNTQSNGLGTTYAASSSYVISGNQTLYAIWTSDAVWRIDYDGNSNTGGSAPNYATVTKGQAATASTNSANLTRTGYTFSGWNTQANGNGTNVAESGSFTPTANVTLYAKWSPNTITVNFYANGGSGSMSAQSVTAGTSTALSANAFARDGYTFNGWNETSTATGTNFTDGQPVTIVENLDLYAKWIATITYNGNSNTGGAIPSSQSQADGSITLRSNSGSLVRTGYTFGGWNTLANGSGTTLAEGASYTLSGSVTLYAKWIPDTLSVHFDANGGSGSMINQSVTSGVATALTLNAFTYSGFGFVNWNTVSGGGGTSYTDGQLVTISTNLTVYAQWATEYSVTYSLDGGSGSTPTETPKAAGSTFTLAGSSGFSKSGYSFSGWSCNSGSTQSAGASFTMPSSALTCVAQWTANSSGSNGNSNSAPAAAPGKSGSTPAVIKKAAVVTLVTVATTPVKATAVVISVPVSTPGNSGTTPAASGTTGSTSTTTPGNSGTTPAASGTTGSSSGNSGTTGSTTTTTPGNSGSTPAATGTVPSGSTNQTPISVANTKLSQTTALTSAGNTEITFKGVGVSAVTVKDDVVSVAARPGFSGKTTVAITLTNNEEISQITANVIVIPLPVTNPVVKPVAEDKSRVTWVRSPNAIGYEVIQDGKVICTTAKVTCTVSTLIAPEAKVEIKALGRDQTESLVKEAKYVEAAVTKVVPDIALVVNFDTAKYNLDAGDKALIRAFAADVVKYGYTKIDISGHTDSRGGIDNNVLSNNRAKASRDYLLSLLPNLKVTINGYADAINVATNGTAEGMAANRRAEFRVVG